MAASPAQAKLWGKEGCLEAPGESSLHCSFGLALLLSSQGAWEGWAVQVCPTLRRNSKACLRLGSGSLWERVPPVVPWTGGSSRAS